MALLWREKKLQVSSYQDDKGLTVDIVEGKVSLDTMNWGARVALPPFQASPQITLIPFGVSAAGSIGPTPEILNVTTDTFELKITENTSAMTWTWRAKGNLLARNPTHSRIRLPVRVTIVLILLAAGVIIALNKRVITFGRFPFDTQGEYIGSPPHQKAIAVVFVHGIFGTKEATWFNQKQSFPTLLESDPEFHDQSDVFVYEYFTPEFGDAASIVQLADQLRGRLADQRVFENHQHVVFLSHSMGGLIVRQFLLNKRNLLGKVSMLYFYATPTNGAEITEVASKLSNNPQLRGMFPLKGNDLLQSIQSNWLGSDDATKVPSYCAYELLPTYGVFVVSQSSATGLCNKDLDPITANHIDIVKPKDRDDPRYTRFASALRASVIPTLSNGKVINRVSGRPKNAIDIKREGESLMRDGKYGAACDKFKAALTAPGLDTALETQIQNSLLDCQARLAMGAK